VKKTYRALRKFAVFSAGSIVIIAGIILLVIPGPGLLTIAVGLLILSSEFEWAERHLKRVKKRMRDIYEKAKMKQEELKDKKQKK
jgi:uncharacterized protein (TIGR02611 family)